MLNLVYCYQSHCFIQDFNMIIAERHRDCIKLSTRSTKKQRGLLFFILLQQHVSGLRSRRSCVVRHVAVFVVDHDHESNYSNKEDENEEDGGGGGRRNEGRIRLCRCIDISKTCLF